MPLAHIQQFLWHKSMSTTSGFYAFAALETLANAMISANREETKEGKKWGNDDILKKYTLFDPKNHSDVLRKSIGVMQISSTIRNSQNIGIIHFIPNSE